MGAELRLYMNLIYYVETEVQLGFARGLSKDGSDHVYLVTSIPF